MFDRAAAKSTAQAGATVSVVASKEGNDKIVDQPVASSIESGAGAAAVAAAAAAGEEAVNAVVKGSVGM